MALVELSGVSRIYNGAAAPITALHPLDLSLHEREFVALMGPSGSGKSSLLTMLGAMAAPTAGRVTVDGIDVYSLTRERLADFRREYLGFVFQQLFLLPYLTALENVMLPLAATRMTNRTQRDMARGALDRVALGDKMARLPRDLSGGEQQRVAIARAIVNRPPLLLADEPTGCLDSATGRGIIEAFLELREQGQTVFMVTHDAIVASAADRIVQLRDGRLLTAVAPSAKEAHHEALVHSA